MAVFEKIIAAKIKEFDALRKAFLAPDLPLFLLKFSEDANEFETIEKVEDGWYLEYSEYRQSFKLQIATFDSFFGERIRQATHARIGAEVYQITDGDTLPPQGEEPVWKLYCQRFFSSRQFGAIY